MLVRVKLTGICGSDVHIYKGENPFATYPRVFGHEFTGEVVEIGSGVTTLKPGDHVLLAKYAGTEVKVDGETYTILRQGDVLAIVD